uniref:Uncharacterized protein n=1 Tax=Cupriavidus pinatubonensis (strain JMP 134 / LMG 1197) TaxID=264198 RepID=Q46S85_CUPPJ
MAEARCLGPDDQARGSILDVAGCLPSLLLGMPLVLAAARVALVVGSTAILLGVPGILARILPHVAPFAALLRLFRRRGHA